MRVVLDTNLIVSGSINPLGQPGRLLSLVFERKLTLCMTPHLATELRRVFSYPKLQRRLKGAEPYGRTPQALVEDIVSITVTIPDVPPKETWVVRDPEDDWVIQCALSARAPMRSSLGTAPFLLWGPLRGSLLSRQECSSRYFIARERILPPRGTVPLDIAIALPMKGRTGAPFENNSIGS